LPEQIKLNSDKLLQSVFRSEAGYKPSSVFDDH